MFTGIVAAVGSVASVTPSAGGVRLIVKAADLDLMDAVLGESIAVNGVCLTVIALPGGAFEADVSRETLACTAGFAQGARVNLERALRLADRLGGHLVSGHVDGVGEVTAVTLSGDNRVVRFAVPGELARYIARKGSVAINGVSLTVNEVSGMEFSVNLIPHTLAETNLGDLAAGSRVNVEVDTVARYVERLQSFGSSRERA
jgi:riboflavin synthase